MPSSSAKNFGGLNVRPPLAGGRARIGLLGGSFNPAHAGHRLISEMALKQLKLDKVWWLVSPGNPIKSHDNLASLKDRVKLAEDISNHRQIEITSFESSLPTSYTAQTIKFLNRRYPSVNFVWLMGADNLMTFHHWQHWQDIFMSVPIAVFDRPGYRLKAMASPAAHRFASFKLSQDASASLSNAKTPAWSYLTHRLSHLSSTALRHRSSVAIGHQEKSK